MVDKVLIDRETDAIRNLFDRTPLLDNTPG
jgi:hypothetical protein